MAIKPFGVSFSDLNSSEQKRNQELWPLPFMLNHSHFLFSWLYAKTLAFIMLLKQKGHRGMKAFLYPSGSCQKVAGTEKHCALSAQLCAAQGCLRPLAVLRSLLHLGVMADVVPRKKTVGASREHLPFCNTHLCQQYPTATSLTEHESLSPTF